MTRMLCWAAGLNGVAFGVIGWLAFPAPLARVFSMAVGGLALVLLVGTEIEAARDRATRRSGGLE
jgi:hypothetical protein